MLYASLILSAILLAVVNGLVLRSERPFLPFLCCGLVFVFGPFCLTAVFPPVVLQVLLLFVAFGVWRVSRRKPLAFLPLSLLATVIAYGVCAGLAYRDVTRLREKFPYESLEGRLPSPRPGPRDGPLPEVTARRLDRLEETIKGASHFGVWRTDSLRRLHEDAVDSFVSSPGFGSARMTLLSREWLVSGMRTDPPLPQPDPAISTGQSVVAPGGEVRTPDTDPLYDLHWNSLTDFVHPEGFGYVRDRGHVAGFQVHQFSRTPKPGESWRLQTLELVGLALHDAPVVYVSPHLPRMDELREAPTRPPDAFEAAGLESLRSGEDLVVGGTADGLRMLGSLRSTEQCLACHGGERGDLVGAFSYTLRRATR
jgi:hypothetical protein